MKVLIIDHTGNSNELPELLRKQEFEFACRYKKGVYQLANYPTKTYLYDKEDEQKFFYGEEVWIHRDEVSMIILK